MSERREDDLPCQELVELVTEYLDGALSRRDCARFEHHLDDCPGCGDHLDQVRQTITLSGRLQEADLAEPARSDLLRAFRDWRREAQ